MMQSVQTKYIVLTLGCTFVSSGIMHATRIAEIESAKTMNFVCGEQAQEINALLSRI